MQPGHQRIPFDDNRKPFLTALSYVDGITEVPIYADPATGKLLANTGASSGLVTSAYDYIGYTNTNSTTDTYVYKIGGASGTTVATVTIVYTDTTKSQISSITKT